VDIGCIDSLVNFFFFSKNGKKMVTHKEGGYRMHRFICEIGFFQKMEKKWSFTRRVDIGCINSLVKLFFFQKMEKKNPNQNYLYTIRLCINLIHTQTLKLTHIQLLERFKCESKLKTSKE
jgi:hypothetical protein